MIKPPLETVRAVCFDLFNTLVSVGRVPETVGRFTADILGIDRRRWRDACFGPAHVIWQPIHPFQSLLQLAHSIDPGISLELVQQAVSERQARFDYALTNVGQEIIRPLQNLRRKGLRLGLISNAASSEVRAWRSSPLAALFDAVSFSCDCGYVKPDTAIYRHTLEALEIDAGHCLFVGDGGSDEHRGAHAMGMQPVLITHYLHSDEYPQRQEKYRGILSGVVRDVLELDKWFGQEKKGG